MNGTDTFDDDAPRETAGEIDFAKIEKAIQHHKPDGLNAAEREEYFGIMRDALKSIVESQTAQGVTTAEAVAQEIETDPEEILTRAGMKIENAADFIKREIQPPRWIVPDFIAQRMKGDLCGGAKSMKTFLGLQMAVCIAAGRDFLNLHVEAPHTVAYLNLELFDWNAQERVVAICDALEIDPERLNGRLHIFNMRENPAALRGQIDLGTCRQCPKSETCKGKSESICKAARAEKILAAFSAVLKRNGVELVIIDPRYKLIMPGEDENTGDGLRGVLALRDTLARDFAAIIVTHDPKGDTSERKTTDRGAGSYTAGADFDFRLTIDRARDFDETKGDLLYVIGSSCRARRTPPKVGVRFTGQVFQAEDGLTTELKTPRTKNQLTEREKIEKNRREAEDFRTAALALANEHGSGDPIATQIFKLQLQERPGGAIGEKKLDNYFNAMLAEGVIEKQPELVRDPKTKAVHQKGKSQGGRTFIMTPEAARAYCEAFNALEI